MITIMSCICAKDWHISHCWLLLKIFNFKRNKHFNSFVYFSSKTRNHNWNIKIPPSTIFPQTYLFTFHRIKLEICHPLPSLHLCDVIAGSFNINKAFVGRDVFCIICNKSKSCFYIYVLAHILCKQYIFKRWSISFRVIK